MDWLGSVVSFAAIGYWLQYSLDLGLLSCGCLFSWLIFLFSIIGWIFQDLGFVNTFFWVGIGVIPWILPIAVPFSLSVWQWSILRQMIKPAASWILWSIPAYLVSLLLGILCGSMVNLTIKNHPLAALIGSVGGGCLYGILASSFCLANISS